MGLGVVIRDDSGRVILTIIEARNSNCMTILATELQVFLLVVEAVVERGLCRWLLRLIL